MAESTGRDAYANCIQRVEVVGGTLDATDFEPQCFTDDSGTTFFGIWELNNGVLEINFFTVDAGGNIVPYVPTSTPIPCNPNDTEVTQTCWEAINDGVGYNAGDQLNQIQFWDTSSAPPVLTATIWYNQTQMAALAAPPVFADLQSCVVIPPQIVPGRIESCILSDVTQIFDVEATFDQANPAIDTLATDPVTEAELRRQIGIALQTQREEEAKGVPVTTFRITTDGPTVYEFLPSALIVNVVNGLMSFQTPDVITWPFPVTENIVTTEYAALTDCVCEDVEMVQRVNADNTVTLLSVVRPRVLDVDGNKEVIPLPLPIGQLGPFSGQCIDAVLPWPPTVGYLQTCDSFDITLPINVEGTFSDALSATTTLTSTTATITLIADSIRDAIDYENAEIQAGLPVTNFIIRTDGGSVFEFPPSAFVSTSGTAITFTTADLVTWPGPLVDTIQRIEYSKFDNCGCQAVEMLQRVDDDGNVQLLKVLDPSVRDANGNKREIETPFTFGITGPFAGPCPESIPVFDLVPLCCDDDLLNNNPDIANQRLAWLDGADTANMLDAVGGVPIAGNQGDQVFEVQDKIAPGVAPSFVIPTATAPGDIAPINPPTLDLDAINGLPVLSFDSANRERIRLDTNNPAGNSFTLFYLVAATDLVLQSNATVLAVGPNNTDGDAFDNVDGAWQLSLDGVEPSFIFRSEMEATEYAAGVDPVDIVRTGPFSDERSPSNPFGDLYERAIAREADFFDGQFHLITVTWDNPTNILSCFFDGDLRHQSDWTGFPLSTAAMASDYFRLFGNRQGAAFLSGQLAELFFADAALTPEEISIVNAYLICKWGIDPTVAAGGAGDLSLAPAGTYGAPTPIVQITRSDGVIVYRNTDTGLEFPVPPVPGLSICATGGVLGFDVEQECYEDANQRFVRHTAYDAETGTVVNVFDTEVDMVTPYNTIGNEQPCVGTGGAPVGVNVEPRYTILAGAGNWVMGADTHSVSITDIAHTPAAAAPTVTTAEGTFDLFEGQTLTFAAHDSDTPLQQPLTVTTVGPNDAVAINWIEEV